MPARPLVSAVVAVAAAALLVVCPPASQADPSAPTGSELADAQSAPDAAGAMQIAQAYDHSVLVDSDTSQTASVSAMPDGSFQLTESSDPVRVQVGGVWTPIDTSLSVAADGMLAPAATTVAVEFSDGGTGAMAKVESAAGTWLTESWSAGALPAPTVSGAVATYPDVFPGVDLQLTATAAGMDEVLVVKTADAAADTQLQAVRLDIGGASTSTVADTGDGTGAAAVSASDGLTSASPSWWDSTDPDSGPAGPGGAALPRPLSDEVTPSSIVLDVSEAALTAGVSYPLYADPDWGVLARTFVDSAYPTQSYWNGTGASDSYQHVGFIDAADSDDGVNHTTRAFWQLDTHLLAGTDVLGATLNTTETYSYSCTAREVDLYSVGGISSGTTWDSEPAFGTFQSSAKVAWGYSSACSARAVGFNVLNAATSAAAASASSITLGMKVPNDTSAPDKYTWKKFAASATLVVSYNHIPGVPAGRSVKPCSFVCGAPVMTNSFYPTLSAIAADADGGNLTYNFQVWAGHSAAPTVEEVVGSVHNVAYGSVGYWTDTSHLPDGDYEYRVQAFDGIDAGAWSGYLTFTVDTIAPSPPVLSESGGVAQLAGSRSGTVGVTQEAITMTPNPSDHAWGYAYAIYPSGASVTFPSNLTCNTTVQGYTTVCPGAVNAPASVTVTMPDDNSVFAATEFDAAGNAPSAPSSVTFYANGDYAGDSYSADLGHSWLTDSAGTSCPSGSPAPVPDSAVYGPTPSSAADLTTVSGAACWTQDASAPAATGAGIAFSGNGVLSFTGAPATATTAGPAIDTTKSFTVAAWLNPTQAAANIYQSALAQDGTNLSAFLLQNGGGHWRFCVTNATATTVFQGNCVSPTTVILANTWTFVAGVYNAEDHQLLLYTSSTDTPGAPAVDSQPASSLAAGGPVAIGRERTSTNYLYWAGSVLDPVVMQGVADATQLHYLADLIPPSSLPAPVTGS